MINWSLKNLFPTDGELIIDLMTFLFTVDFAYILNVLDLLAE